MSIITSISKSEAAKYSDPVFGDRVITNERINNDARYIHDIDCEIPTGLAKPPIWKIFAIPVRQRSKTKGGIILTDESLDIQNWTHRLYKIAACGKHVYRGDDYERLGVTEDEAPKVGDLWIVQPKNPDRFVYKGHTVVILNDDMLQGRIEDPATIEFYKFNGLEL